MVKEYIGTIVQNGKKEDMDRLSDIMQHTLHKLEEYDPDDYKDYKIELYEMAYGKTLTKEMAEKWVNSMVPSGKWNYETTSLVRKQNGITNIDDISFYVVMNMLYSDMSNVLGDGDSPESITKYIEATKDWLNDEDVGANKLYKYWRYVAK